MTRHVLLGSVGLILAPLLQAATGKADKPDAPEPQLTELRQNFARHYFDPEARLRLARYLADHGQRLIGFYMSEECRHTLGDKSFGPAHAKVFLDYDLSPAHEAELKATYATKKTAKLAVKLADIQVGNKKPEKGEEYALEAIALEPENLDWVKCLAAIRESEGKPDETKAMIAGIVAKYPKSLAAALDEISRKAEPMSEKTKAAKYVAELKPLVVAALARFPDSPDLRAAFGMLLLSEGKSNEADAEFRRVAELDPESAERQGNVGGYFLKTRERPGDAFPYYLNAYFLDPHYYDWEYAESRIRKISYEQGEQTFGNFRKKHRSLAEIAALDDPVILGMVLDEMKEHWSDDYVTPLARLLRSDDPNLRANATDALMKHPSKQVTALEAKLEKDDDLRVHSTVLYLIPGADQSHAVARLKAYLSDPADLIRFDAASTLIEQCGPEGMAAVVAARDKEPNEWWKAELINLK